MDIATDLSVKKQLDEFTTNDQATKKTEEAKPQTEIKIPVTELTSMKLDDNKKPECRRFDPFAGYLSLQKLRRRFETHVDNGHRKRYSNRPKSLFHTGMFKDITHRHYIWSHSR